MRLFQVVWDYIQGSLLTTKGDLVKRGAAVNARLGVGNAKEVLGVTNDGTDLLYRPGIEVVLTKGDLIKRGAAVAERFSIGAAKKVLGVNDVGNDLEYRDGIEIATTKGDLIKRGVAACARFAVGAAHQIIRVNPGANDLLYADNTIFYAEGLGVNIGCNILAIGDWDMDGLASVSIAHGLTLAKIRNIKVLIRKDDDSAYFDLYTWAVGVLGGEVHADATNIIITRILNGYFDDNNFDETPFNRGWITIWHEL